MNPETAKKALGKLQGFFNRKLTDDAVAFYVNEFKRVEDDVFVVAVDESCRAEKSLPTPRLLREYIATAQRRKLEPTKPPTLSEVFRNKPTDSECFRESRSILRRISEGKLTADGLVSEMVLMEEAFPGRGWGSEADELKNHLEKRHGGAVDR